MRIRTSLMAAAIAAAGLTTQSWAALTSSNLLTNPGAEAGNTSGWTVGGSTTVDTGTFDPGINPHSGSYDFLGHSGALDTLSQSVTLSTVPSLSLTDVDAGTVSANVSFWEQGLNQGTPSDNANVTLTFKNAGGSSISAVTTTTIDSHGGSWQQFAGSFTVPADTRSIAYQINFVRNDGSDNDSFVDDASLTIGSAATPPSSVPLPAAAKTGLASLAGLALLTLTKRHERLAR